MPDQEKLLWAIIKSIDNLLPPVKNPIFSFLKVRAVWEVLSNPSVKSPA